MEKYDIFGCSKAHSSAEIGHNFVIIAVGDEFVAKKLYFVCVLCDLTQKFSQIQNHLMSTNHKLKFLSHCYPSTAEIVESIRKVEPAKLSRILECVCDEITRNVQPYQCFEMNYLEYEESDGVDEKLLKENTQYDSNAEFVLKMNNVLQKFLEPKGIEANGSFNHGDDPVVDSSENTVKTEDSDPAEKSNLKESSDASQQVKEVVEAEESNTADVDIQTQTHDMVSISQCLKEGYEIDQKFATYSRHPENYPNFDNEWVNFYLNNSYSLMMQCLKNQTPINYLPMWRVYWSQRVREIKRMELQKMYKTKRGISPENEPIDDVSVKRPKLDLESNSNKIVMAYYLAYEHFKEGKHVTAEEILRLVNRDVESCQQGDFDDDELMMLYENLDNLSPQEHEKFLTVLRNIHLFEPERYENLQSEMRKIRNNKD